MTPRDWSTAIIDRPAKVGSVPRYGDPEWQQLGPTDPRFVAAIAVAAECWRAEDDPARLRERLQTEVTAGRAAEEKIDAELFRQTAATVRRMADQPTLDELRRRRTSSSPTSRTSSSPLRVVPGGRA